MHTSKESFATCVAWFVKWMVWPFAILMNMWKRNIKIRCGEALAVSLAGLCFFWLTIASLYLENFSSGIKVSLAVGFFLMYLLVGLFAYFERSYLDESKTT